MPAEELDMVDEILGKAAADEWVAPGDAGSQADERQADGPQTDETPADETPADEPAADEPAADKTQSTLSVAGPVSVASKRRLRLRLRNPFARLSLGTGRVRWAVRFALTFVLGAVACVAILAAVAMVAFNANSNRVVPGVHVGSVDLSGLSRDQVISRLNASYSYLGQGVVTVTTPIGAGKISYERLGRGPNVALMADEAMGIGHSGDQIGDAVAMLRTAISGRALPVAVRIDPVAVATGLRQLAIANQLPQDAQAWVRAGTFAFESGTTGRGLDEPAISGAIIAHLTEPDAPASFQAGGAFVELRPRVSDKDAQAAIAAAQKMLVAVDLTFGSGPAAPASGQSASPAKTYTIPVETVLGWIVFGTNSDGTYGPSADPDLMKAYLSQLSQQIRTAPVEPKMTFDSKGVPSLQGGSDGAEIDVPATSRAIAAYLDTLASGWPRVSTIAMTTAPVSPIITAATLRNLVAIGSWTTTFYPDISNGNGANIRVPATLLNGQVVASGQGFSFLTAVSPVDAAHGYALGGVIQDGKSNHTGAMGGGICSASTTMFNAAARAGLEIDERHAHAYYIDRYPVGLDATVFSNGYTTLDLKWTNDTPNPIVIVSGATYGRTSSITVQLWSLPLDRKVTFSPEFRANIVKAGDSTVYTDKLQPGQWGRAEFPTDGYDTSRTRTVTGPTGNVIHTDTWFSHYTKVDGVLQLGGSPPEAPTPPPAPPGPTPTPAVLAPESVRAARIRTARDLAGR